MVVGSVILHHRELVHESCEIGETPVEVVAVGVGSGDVSSLVPLNLAQCDVALLYVLVNLSIEVLFKKLMLS